MNRQQQRELYNAFGPTAVGPDHPHWVDLDAARGFGIARSFADEIGLSGSPLFRVVATAPGLGVTSVLLELEHHLRADGFDVHSLDMASKLDLQSPLTEERVLEAIAHAVDQSVVSRMIADGALPRAALYLERGPSRQVLNESASLKRVVILHDLHRTAGTATNHRLLSDALARVLRRLQWDARLPFHVVCTAPMELTLDGRLEEARVLPALDVEFPLARHGLADLALRRAPMAVELTGGLALDEVVRWSGGSVRGLMRLFQEIVLRIHDAPLHRVESALLQVQRAYQAGLTTTDIELLRRVEATGVLHTGADEGWERHLASGALLPVFEGTRLGFRVHPAVRSLLAG